MGQGVGRLLLYDALRCAQAAGALGLAIVSDPHAAGFYLRLGGRPAGVLLAPMPGAPERSLPRFWLDAAVT
jgi:predicted N-acetyltransferase YhbS